MTRQQSTSKENSPKPGRFYTIPKIHKQGYPGRPIVSSNGHPTKRISQFVDHHLQPLVTKLPSYLKYTTHFLNFKGVKEDPKSLQNDLETAPWWICSIFDEIDDVTWAWETMFKDVVDSYVTKRLVKIRQHSLPWMNSEIRKAMNKRYKLLKLCDGTPNTNQYWEEYKSARNQVTALLRSAETQYWKERFDKANNSSMFWKTVHSISGSQKSSRIGPVKDENSLEV